MTAAADLERAARVFLSCSHTDQPQVVRLAADLEAGGDIEVLRDNNDIPTNGESADRTTDRRSLLTALSDGKKVKVRDSAGRSVERPLCGARRHSAKWSPCKSPCVSS